MSRAHAIWATGEEQPREGWLIHWNHQKGAKRGNANINGFTFATIELCEPYPGGDAPHREWHLESWHDHAKPWRCVFGVPLESMALKYEATEEDAKAFCDKYMKEWISEVVQLAKKEAEPEGPAPE